MQQQWNRARVECHGTPRPGWSSRTHRTARASGTSRCDGSTRPSRFDGGTGPPGSGWPIGTDKRLRPYREFDRGRNRHGHKPRWHQLFQRRWQHKCRLHRGVPDRHGGNLDRDSWARLDVRLLVAGRVWRPSTWTAYLCGVAGRVAIGDCAVRFFQPPLTGNWERRVPSRALTQMALEGTLTVPSDGTSYVICDAASASALIG